MTVSEEPTASATKFGEGFTTNAEGELACLSEKVRTEPLHTVVACWEELGGNSATLYKNFLFWSANCQSGNFG